LIFLTEELDDKSPAQGQDEDFENVMQAAVAKRLVSSSFGLSFPNANLDRFHYLLIRPPPLKHTHTHTHTHTINALLLFIYLFLFLFFLMFTGQ